MAYRYNLNRRTIEDTMAINNEQLANELRQSIPNIPVIPDNIQVIVRRDTYGTWFVRVSHNGSTMPLPEIGVIKSLLPPEWKRLLGGRHSRRRRVDYYLIQALEAGLPTQVLHDTLQAWAFTWVRATAEASSEVSVPQSQDDSFLLKAQPATIFVGGKSFKLVPTGERNNTNIYRHIRDKAKAIAQIEVQAKLDKAQTDARILVSEANERARVVRAEVDQLRASLGNQAPEWVRNSGRPIRLYNGRWEVGIKVSTYLEDIRYRVGNWGATLHWSPVHPADRGEDYYVSRPMWMWFILGSPEGGYTMSSIHSDQWLTVHTTSRACMEIQGLPRHITSDANLRSLEQGISRGIRVINWNSPLSTSLNSMYPLYVEQIPEMFKRLIRAEVNTPQPGTGVTPAQYLEQINRNGVVLSWDRIETDVEELNYTFTVGATTANVPR
jgi:hypothetical protein